MKTDSANVRQCRLFNHAVNIWIALRRMADE
jgi:hypothetical protein